MSLLDMARKMKGKKIKIRYVGDDRIDESELVVGKAYEAICNGVGAVENALFTDLIDEQGNKWSGQLNGFDGFRFILYPRTERKEM